MRETFSQRVFLALCGEGSLFDPCGVGGGMSK